MDIGKRIKDYIQKQGLTQSFVANKTGIPIQTLNAICNGKQKISVERYFSICDVLNVSVDQFKQQKPPERRVS